MAVSPKYNVKFQRGESAFNQLLGQFLGTRVKENKERQAMRLKAADPTEKLKTLRSLIRDRNRIVAEMVKARQGVSVTEKSGGGRTSNVGAKFRSDNLRQIEEYERGRKAYETHDSRSKTAQAITNYIKAMEKNPSAKQKTDERNALMVQLSAAHATLPNAIADSDRAAGLRSRVEEDILLRLSKDHPKMAQEAILVLRNMNSPSREDQEIYRSGGRLTAEQKALIPSGGGGRSITKRGQAPSPEAEALFKQQIEILDKQIKSATEDYERSQDEYKNLLRGPDFNMALAPIATRPSAMGEIIDDFTRLQQVDPSYARDVMAASDEAGRFTAPKPYEELLAVRGAAGKSPFDFVLDQTGMIDRMTFPFEIPDDDSKPLRDKKLSPEDARVILSNVQRMSDAVNSPLFDGSEFGNMTITQTRPDPNDPEQSVTRSTTKSLSAGMSMLSRIAKRGLEDPDKAVEAASDVSRALTSWSGSLSNEQVEAASKATQPAGKIAGYIRTATDAYDNFLETRNAEEYRRVLSDTYNKVAATQPEIRGLVGDAFLNEIERFSAVDESQRLPEELNYKLTGLRDTAEELAARNVLTLPDPIEIDIEGTRGPRSGKSYTPPDFETEQRVEG